MARVIKLQTQLRVEYSIAELDEKRDELTTVILGSHEVEHRKAEAAKQFKEQLEALYSRRDVLATQIKARGELRLVDCAVEYNVPIIGVKRIVRLDTGELIKDEPMTDDERQELLFDDLSNLEKNSKPAPPETPETPPLPDLEPPPDVEISFRSFQDIAAVIIAMPREEQEGAIAEMTKKLAERLAKQEKIADRNGNIEAIANADEAQQLAETWLFGCVMAARDDIDPEAAA